MEKSKYPIEHDYVEELEAPGVMVFPLDAIYFPACELR